LVRFDARTLAIAFAFVVSTGVAVAPAQTPGLQQRVAEAKGLMQLNRRQLSRYTWQVQESISVNGEVKSEDIYQVQVAPDGTQVRTLVSQPVAPASGGRQHGIRHRIEDDYQQYGQQVAALVKSYTPLSGSRVQQLYGQGAVALRSAGAPGYAAIVISNYLKPGDSIVVTMSEQPKALSSAAISTYLSGPSDPVSVQVRYANLPDGTFYAASTTVNGQSKSLTIVDRAMNFTLRQ
jgi:hypothetical protein